VTCGAVEEVKKEKRVERGGFTGGGADQRLPGKTVTTEKKTEGYSGRRKEYYRGCSLDRRRLGAMGRGRESKARPEPSDSKEKR